MTDSPEGTPAAENAAPHAVSRRRLFGAVGAGAVLAGAGAVIGRVTADESSGADHADVVAFRGEHQAGITTPAQDRMHFVAFDVTTKSRDELITLLQTWTAMAERMTAGQEATEDGATGDGPYAPPSDTGEALDLAPSQLTLTIGFGPSLFDDRFGLADKKPAALLDLPHFRADNLDPNRSGGDIAIQACANDPQVAVHAIRNLARVAFGTASVKWSQLGFGRTSSTSTTQATPRNLFGFKDGTANIKAEDPDALAQHVWVDPTDDQAWMAGGSFLVARRIRMLIEQWDRAVLKEQEAVIGRSKRSGSAARWQGRVRRARSRFQNGTRLRHPGGFTRAPGLCRGTRWDSDLAPRIQLHGRLRWLRPPGRGTVLRCVLPESGRAVCSDAAKPFTTRCR